MEDVRMRTITILLAILLTGMLQADQLSESGFLQYLKESFSRSDEDINEVLVDECALFLRTFPTSTNNPDILFILASIHEQENSYTQAMIYYLEILRLYPGGPKSGEARDAVRAILQQKAKRTFESVAQKINDFLNDSTFQSSLSDRFHRYLAFMVELNHPDLNPLLIERLIYYLHTFDQDVRYPDQILFWLGDLYRKQRDWLEAMMTYEKILYIKPESLLASEILYNLAQLQYNEMSRYQEARDNFVRLITDFPEKEISGDGQFYLAELYQYKLDNFSDALTNYRLLVEAYPENTHAVEALKRIAEIHYDADRYEQAIEIYDEIYQRYRTHPYAPESLIEIEAIYRRKFDDYQRAAETLQKYAESYPEREDAPERYYDAAEMYREDLKNKEKSIEILNAIIQKFPDSSYAEKAKEDIAEMDQEK